MKHLWLIKKDSSTMLFYHSYNNPPLKAMIVSGLLAAMNNFSEVEIQSQGIQSIEMHDLRWVYLNSPENNLLLIAADAKAKNSKVMRARLKIILDLFIKKFHIKLGYWKEDAINLELFQKFRSVIEKLEHEWAIADETKDLGHILDLLGVYQQIMVIYIDIIKENIAFSKYPALLEKLDTFSPQLREWYGTDYNPRAFETLQLFIPKIDCEHQEIFFFTSPGQAILGKENIEFNPDYIKAFYYMLIQYYSETIQNALVNISWYRLYAEKFMPYFLSKWDFLESLGILRELIKAVFHGYSEENIDFVF